MVAPVELYFDVISPYAYLAYTQLQGLAALHGREVRTVPVLFAGLLNAHGTRGPAEVPAKRAYLIRDVLRKATSFGVPFQPPPSHPFNPLLALRAAIAEPRLVGPLFDAVWATGVGAETPEQVAAIAREAGLDAADVLMRAAAAEVKAELRANTDAAIARGVFGVPTMIVDGELFWGCDALPLLDRFLAGAQRLDLETIDRWTALVSSSDRKAP
jgi:2-hydroxychromene-2-carboxylate isomerase